jgi:hypothetical protein
MSTTTPTRKISQVKNVHLALVEAMQDRDFALAEMLHRTVFDWVMDEEEKDALLSLIAQVMEAIEELKDYHGDN